MSLSERALAEILMLRIFWVLSSPNGLLTREGIQDLVGRLIRFETNRQQVGEGEVAKVLC